MNFKPKFILIFFFLLAVVKDSFEDLYGVQIAIRGNWVNVEGMSFLEYIYTLPDRLFFAFMFSIVVLLLIKVCYFLKHLIFKSKVDLKNIPESSLKKRIRQPDEKP